MFIYLSITVYLSIYVLFSQSIKIEAIFVKAEINNE